MYAIFGTGGFAREILDIVVSGAGGKDNVVMFEDEPKQSQVNGVDVFSTDYMIERAKTEEIRFSVALGSSLHRRRIAEKLEDAGMLPFNVTAGMIHSHSEIQRGLVAVGFTIIQSNVQIGVHFQLNMQSYVAHDCVIGDYVTFAPHVCCNGNVKIGNNVYVGTGAMIRNGSADRPLVIGDGAVIGMGAVVLRDVEPGSVVVGNPATRRIVS